jgi:hypothetical protein
MGYESKLKWMSFPVLLIFTEVSPLALLTFPHGFPLQSHLLLLNNVTLKVKFYKDVKMDNQQSTE